MVKKVFIILIFVLFSLVLLKIAYDKLGNKVCFENECFYVEIADTEEERSQGLMFRENLEKNRGMLFIFEKEDEYPFWMKNTLIPLDIVWINKEKEVVFIGRNIQPCEKGECPTVMPGEKAKYVLEINAGTTEGIGLEIGDILDF